MSLPPSIHDQAGIRKWKMLLLLVGIGIMVMPLIYSNYLARKLSDLELKKVEIFEKSLAEITNTENLEEDVSFELEMINKSSSDLKIITVNRNKEIQLYNYPEGASPTAELEKIKKTGIPPLESEDYTVYYQYPEIITWLSYFPLMQLALLLVYAGIGYAVFNTSRRQEQNRIWVGMAKETAHQLGTPISGIVGWLNSLDDPDLADKDRQLIVQEIHRDVDKLKQVADRFSKIGSKPELQRVNIVPVLYDIVNYMQARASRGIQFSINVDADAYIESAVNVNLFQWVVENVIRNALDAMEGEGHIRISVHSEAQKVYIDISDTGKGIPPRQWETVFKPGVTTKVRGWGLGLSLARRIIENYHAGKIYIKESNPKQGTTIRVQLPA